jgi:MoaA/NifB/PqqE/SkfB family radical SAM enzyme
MNPRIANEIHCRQELEAKRAQRLGGWAKGETPGPFKVMYFPTNACNLKCAICWQRKGVHDYSELPAERQVALIEEAHQLGVREFVIGGGGEPLARWSTLRPLFDAIKRYEMYGLLFTNGTLITEEIATHLVEIKWDKVLVSIDGKREVNDEVRESGSYDRILQGLSTLLTARSNRPLPVVGAGCVLTRQGIAELPDLIQMLGEFGCDQFNLIRLVVHLDSQRRFAVPENKLSTISTPLLKAMDAAKQAGMATNLSHYLDKELVQSIEEFELVLLSTRTTAGQKEPFWDALCFEPFSNLVIHANGMVGPCCMSGDNPVASVLARNLSDVWFGDEFSRLRDGILNRKPEPYCRICDLNVFEENQRLRVVGASQ